MHALVVVAGRALGARWVQEERAHMLGDTRIYVRIATVQSAALSRRTGGRARPGRFVPPSNRRRFISHLHNHRKVFGFDCVRTENRHLIRT